MTLSVSNLNNAELDSLLKDLFDDSNTARINKITAGGFDSEVTSMNDDQSAEQSVESYYTRSNQIYNNIDTEVSDLKLKIVLLSKELVDKNNELEAKDEELALVTFKLNNTVKAKERLEKKLMSYENIIERLKPFNDKTSAVINDVSMTTVVDEKSVSAQNVTTDEGRKPVLKENHVHERLSTQQVTNSDDKSKRSKCQFENTGTCRKKNCRNIHPKKTCQNYSNYGVCSFRGCDLRHPWGVCHI